MNQKKKNWIVDVLCCVGFLLSLKPTVTGFSIHEWLGLVVGGVLLVHLLLHWQWMLRVTKHFGKVRRGVQFDYVVDVSLGLGFGLILGTGLVISNLLGLTLTNDVFEVMRVLHVFGSYLTFALMMVKLAKHGDWIVSTTKSVFGLKKRTKKALALAISASEAGQKPEVGKERPANPARREAMRLMLIGGAGAFLAGKWMVDWGERFLVGADEGTSEAVAEGVMSETSTAIATEGAAEQTATVTNEAIVEGGHQNGNGNGRNRNESEEATAAPTVTVTPTLDAETTTGEGIVVTPTVDVLANVAPCRRGLHCAYPGKCREYQDINTNGLCDRGEVS